METQRRRSDGPPQSVDRGDVAPAVAGFLNRLLLAIDERDYGFAGACLADKVDFDTRSLGGIERALSRDEMIAGLQATFRFLKGTQHLLSALVVEESDGESLSAVGQYQAYHFRDDLGDRRLWVHGGRHRYRLRQAGGSFVVTGLRVEMAWTWGDPVIIVTPR
jgi:hypothetical protein